jgi:hypothetical protein
MVWTGGLMATWFWLCLTVSATTILVLRAGGRWRPTVWVAAPKAFEVMTVSAALAVPVFAGLVFLIAAQVKHHRTRYQNRCSAPEAPRYRTELPVNLASLDLHRLPKPPLVFLRI